ATGRPRSVAIRLDCRRALATEMSGSRPDADAVTASTGTVTRVERPFRSRYASTRCGTVFASQTSSPSDVLLYLCPAVGLATGLPLVSTGTQYGSARVAKGVRLDGVPFGSRELSRGMTPTRRGLDGPRFAPLLSVGS